MPKVTRLDVTDYPYFVTTRIDDGSPVFSQSRNADLMLSAIYYWRERGKCYLLGFVIMPSHIHLVVQPRGQERMSSLMQSLKGYTSWQLNRQHGTKGELWQSGFYDYALETTEKLLRRMEYMHNNPVRLGLVEEATAYRYSSVHPANPTDLALFL